MDDLNRQKILHEVIQKKGVDSQLIKAIEECCELASELARFLINDTTPEKVCDEIADVKIMIEQLQIIFNKQTIFDRESFKLNRLHSRLENHESWEHG